MLWHIARVLQSLKRNDTIQIWEHKFHNSCNEEENGYVYFRPHITGPAKILLFGRK